MGRSIIFYFLFIGLIFKNLPIYAQGLSEHSEKIENKKVSENNPYAEIDIKENKEAIDVLLGADRTQKELKVKEIIDNSDKFNPSVLYMLSYVLFQDGEKDEAAFWFYAGQLRGRFDANRCADESAKTVINALNQQIGPLINPYALQDLDKLEEIVQKVLEWDKSTPHNYDQRWINLHGMAVMISTLESQEGKASNAEVVMSLPESEWEEIHRKTQKEYLEGFQQALNAVRVKK